MDLCGGIWKGRKLKAVIPGGVSVPVVPADAMWPATMDYDSIKKAGSSFGTGSLIVMDETTCMVRTLERISRFYMSESCGQCTPCREGTGWLNRMLKRILAGQGRSEDVTMLVDVANRIEGVTRFARSAMPRRGRCRVSSSIIGTSSSTWSSTRAAPSSKASRRTPRPRQHRANDERRYGEYRSQWGAAQGAQGSDDHAGHRSGRHLHPAFLLPRQADHRGQLPHVPGRGGEGAEAAAGLCHARRRGHEGVYTVAEGRGGAARDHGISAHQSSARLPDLRSGRRM